MAGPVLWRVDPIPDESLASLVTRTARRNLLPSAHVLLRQVGARHPNNPTAALQADVDERGLADILRQPLDEIARRRHPRSDEPGFVDFFGAAARADELVFRRRRFAPSALATSAHGRALWSLKTVPCCTETWEYLVDACRCGTVQRWQSADRLERCDSCNAPLSDAPAGIVAAGSRDGLAFLVGLLDPVEGRRAEARSQLPPALAFWDGGMVFEMAVALAPLLGTPGSFRRGFEPAPTDVVRYATSLARAADLIRSWPGSLTEVLVARVQARAASRPNVRYVGLAGHLKALCSPLLPTPVRAAFKEAVAAISSPPGVVPVGQIGMREAALLTGQEERKLAAARRAGLLATRVCMRANRLLPTLDLREIEALNAFLLTRVGPEKASHRLGLPQYAIPLMARDGLIRLADHPYIAHHYGTCQIDEAEFVRFTDELRGRAMPAELDEPVSLRAAARAIGGGAKPWGAIFGEIMSGRIPFMMKKASTDGIFLSGSDAARIGAFETEPEDDLPVRRFSQRDAIEILNLPLKHASLLVGTPKAGQSLRLPVDYVLTLARTTVTLAELCARTGIHPARLEHMLDRRSCARQDAMGWCRNDVVGRLADL